MLRQWIALPSFARLGSRDCLQQRPDQKRCTGSWRGCAGCALPQLHRRQVSAPRRWLDEQQRNRSKGRKAESKAATARAERAVQGLPCPMVPSRRSRLHPNRSGIRLQACLCAQRPSTVRPETAPMNTLQEEICCSGNRDVDRRSGECHYAMRV